jgi:hypothetical protein
VLSKAPCQVILTAPPAGERAAPAPADGDGTGAAAPAASGAP